MYLPIYQVFSSIYYLFFQRCCGLAWSLAGTGIGSCTLTTHGQTTTVAETTVATDVHQTLDIHRGFTTQIAFDGEQRDLITDFFQITIRQVLDLFRIGNLASFANFASASAANAENSGQADLH